jgi:aminopeptidase N
MFSNIMNTVHDSYKESEMSTDDFIKIANKVSEKDLKTFIMQWLSRSDLPVVDIKAELLSENDEWQLQLTVNQTGEPYQFLTTIKIESGEHNIYKLSLVSGCFLNLSL